MLWHPAIAIFAAFDAALVIGIIVAGMIRQRADSARWRCRRSTRVLFDSPADEGQLQADFARPSKLVPRLLAREMTRRAGTPGGLTHAEEFVSALHGAVARSIDEAVGGTDSAVRSARRIAKARGAIRVLGELPSSELLPRLMAVLECGHEELAVESLAVIARNPHSYAGALAILPPFVRDGHPRVRLLASWACLRILRACPEVLSLVQGDSSPDVRVIVVRAAAALGAAGAAIPAGARPVLVRALEDSAPAVRRSAASALLRFASDPAFSRQLLERVHDPVEDVRTMAATALGRAAATIDVQTICVVVSQADARTTRALLMALSGSERTIWPEIAATAVDPSSGRRGAAIRLLATDRHAGAQDVLATLLADQDRRIRFEAAGAAAWLARAGYPQPLQRSLVDRLLVLLAQETHASITLRAIDALSCCGDSRVPAALVERIPLSAGLVRERLVEAGAFFDHLAQWSTRRPRRAAIAP